VKLAILAEGQFAPATAKTAIGVLRYAPYPVVAIVDSTKAGTDAFTHVGTGTGVPVVATEYDAGDVERQLDAIEHELQGLVKQQER